MCRPQPSGPSGLSVSLLSVCTHTHLQRQVPQVSTPSYCLCTCSFSGSCVCLNFVSHLMQKPSDQMGLRGHKVSSGTHSHFQAELTSDYKQNPFFSDILNHSPTPQVLGSLFYAYYVFVRLCIPQFRSISLQLFDLRAMVLCVFNSILPGKINHEFADTCQHIRFHTSVSLTHSQWMLL